MKRNCENARRYQTYFIVLKGKVSGKMVPLLNLRILHTKKN